MVIKAKIASSLVAMRLNVKLSWDDHSTCFMIEKAVATIFKHTIKMSRHCCRTRAPIQAGNPLMKKTSKICILLVPLWDFAYYILYLF